MHCMTLCAWTFLLVPLYPYGETYTQTDGWCAREGPTLDRVHVSALLSPRIAGLTLYNVRS